MVCGNNKDCSKGHGILDDVPLEMSHFKLLRSCSEDNVLRKLAAAKLKAGEKSEEAVAEALAYVRCLAIARNRSEING